MAYLPRLSRINYHCIEDLHAIVLSKSLCWTARFLQSFDPYAKLRMHYDWREHGVSGSPFQMEKAISFHDLFTSIGSPKDLLRVCSDDDRVFVGIAPSDDAWYLRFRSEWDEDGFNLIGRFDITLPKEMAKQFQSEVLPDLQIELEEQDADAFFAEIGPLPGQC